MDGAVLCILQCFGDHSGESLLVTIHMEPCMEQPKSSKNKGTLKNAKSFNAFHIKLNMYSSNVEHGHVFFIDKNCLGKIEI